MPSEFPRRSFAGVFDPTETPASLPAPPDGGAPLPLPPSLAGTPAPPVTESGGGAGAFLKQMGPLVMAMLAARNPGARAAFLQGWQRAQQIEQEQESRQRQQELYERQLDEASAGRQERAEEDKRTRAERLRAAAEARVRNLVDELGAIADPDAFKSRVRSADEQLAAEFGEAYTPGALGQRARMREPNYAAADPAIKRILRQVKDDEAATQVLEQSQYKAAAHALGYLLEDEQGQVMLFRDPEPVTAAPSLQSKVVVVNGERRLANFNTKTGKYDVVEGVMPESDPMMGVAGGGEPITIAEVPLEQRQNVQALLNYRAPLSSYQLSRSPMWQEALKLALRVDPTFDLAQYDIRKKTRVEFTTGKGSRTINSLNTAVGHLDSLKTAADDLNNAGVQVWNRIKNFTLKEVGDPRVVKFDLAANAVSSELATVFKNTGATDQEIKAWRDTLSDAQSPEQLNGAIDQAIELLGSRLQALHNQYDQGMGRAETYTMLSPKSRAILADLGVDVTGFDPGTEFILGGRVDVGGANEPPGVAVGSIVTVKGQKVKVTKINPDGTIEGTVVR